MFEDEDYSFIIPEPEAVVRGYEQTPKIEDFELIKELGQGAFGVVRLMKYKATGQEYAIKFIEKKRLLHCPDSKKQREMLRKEVEIMSKAHHKGAVKLYYQFEDDNYCYILMECIKGGDLFGYLLKQPNRIMPFDKAAKLICELCSTLHYLHHLETPIIHRDIKQENIFLTKEGECQLGDFGGSNFLEKDALRRTQIGTPSYFSPEMLGPLGYNSSVDVWAVGVLIFEILIGYNPFVGPKGKSENLMEKIVKVQILWPSKVDPMIKDLVSKILVKEPEKRITLKEVCHHPFITQYIKNPDKYFVVDKDEENYPYLLSLGKYADKEWIANFEKNNRMSFIFDKSEENPFIKENNFLKRNLTEKEDKISELKTAKENLVIKYEREIQQLKEKLKTASEDITKKNDKIRQLDFIKVQSEIEKNALNDKIKSLESDIESLKQENAAMRQDYENQINKMSTKLIGNLTDSTILRSKDDLPEHVVQYIESFLEERKYFSLKIDKYDTTIKHLYEKLAEYNELEIKMNKEYKKYKETIETKDKTIINQNNLIRKLLNAIGQVSEFSGMCSKIKDGSQKVFSECSTEDLIGSDNKSVIFKRNFENSIRSSIVSSSIKDDKSENEFNLFSRNNSVLSRFVYENEKNK